MKLDDVTLFSIAGMPKYIEDTKKVLRHCTNLCDFAKVKLFSPKEDKEFEHVKTNFLDLSLYNKFCIEELNNYIDTEYCLLVQPDGFIIDINYWTDKFLEYDYVGAPWPGHDHAIGNGGFCLRSKKFLRASAKLEYVSDAHLQAGLSINQFLSRHIAPEDWFIILHNSEHINKEKIKFPNVDLAFQFSVEHPSEIKNFTRDDLSTYKSFGFHGPFNTAGMSVLNERS